MNPIEEMKLAESIETHPWVSNEHREAYVAMVSHLMEIGHDPGNKIHAGIAFILQKQIETTEYWSTFFDSQMNRMASTMRETHEKVSALEREVAALSMAIKSNSVALEAVSKSIPV